MNYAKIAYINIKSASLIRFLIRRHRLKTANVKKSMSLHAISLDDMISIFSACSTMLNYLLYLSDCVCMPTAGGEARVNCSVIAYDWVITV